MSWWVIWFDCLQNDSDVDTDFSFAWPPRWRGQDIYIPVVPLTRTSWLTFSLWFSTADFPVPLLVPKSELSFPTALCSNPSFQCASTHPDIFLLRSVQPTSRASPLKEAQKMSWEVSALVRQKPQRSLLGSRLQSSEVGGSLLSLTQNLYSLPMLRGQQRSIRVDRNGTSIHGALSNLPKIWWHSGWTLYIKLSPGFLCGRHKTPGIFPLLLCLRLLPFIIVTQKYLPHGNTVGMKLDFLWFWR